VLVKEGKDWTAAAKHCQSLSADSHLVVIRNAEEQEDLVSFLLQHNKDGQQNVFLNAAFTPGRMSPGNVMYRGRAICRRIQVARPRFLYSVDCISAT